VTPPGALNSALSLKPRVPLFAVVFIPRPEHTFDGIVRLSMSVGAWVIRTRLGLRRWSGQATVGRAMTSFQVRNRVSISRRYSWADSK
jgi:hypothetical protein